MEHTLANTYTQLAGKWLSWVSSHVSQFRVKIQSLASQLDAIRYVNEAEGKVEDHKVTEVKDDRHEEETKQKCSLHPVDVTYK